LAPSTTLEPCWEEYLCSRVFRPQDLYLTRSFSARPLGKIEATTLRMSRPHGYNLRKAPTAQVSTPAMDTNLGSTSDDDGPRDLHLGSVNGTTSGPPADTPPLNKGKPSAAAAAAANPTDSSTATMLAAIMAKLTTMDSRLAGVEQAQRPSHVQLPPSESPPTPQGTAAARPQPTSPMSLAASSTFSSSQASSPSKFSISSQPDSGLMPASLSEVRDDIKLASESWPKKPFPTSLAAFKKTTQVWRDKLTAISDLSSVGQSYKNTLFDIVRNGIFEFFKAHAKLPQADSFREVPDNMDDWEQAIKSTEDPSLFPDNTLAIHSQFEGYLTQITKATNDFPAILTKLSTWATSNGSPTLLNLRPSDGPEILGQGAAWVIERTGAVSQALLANQKIGQEFVRLLTDAGSEAKSWSISDMLKKAAQIYSNLSSMSQAKQDASKPDHHPGSHHKKQKKQQQPQQPQQQPQQQHQQQQQNGTPAQAAANPTTQSGRNSAIRERQGGKPPQAPAPPKTSGTVQQPETNVLAKVQLSWSSRPGDNSAHTAFKAVTLTQPARTLFGLAHRRANKTSWTPCPNTGQVVSCSIIPSTHKPGCFEIISFIDAEIAPTTPPPATASNTPATPSQSAITAKPGAPQSDDGFVLRVLLNIQTSGEAQLQQSFLVDTGCASPCVVGEHLAKFLLPASDSRVPESIRSTKTDVQLVAFNGVAVSPLSAGFLMFYPSPGVASCVAAVAVTGSLSADVILGTPALTQLATSADGDGTISFDSKSGSIKVGPFVWRNQSPPASGASLAVSGSLAQKAATTQSPTVRPEAAGSSVPAPVSTVVQQQAAPTQVQPPPEQRPRPQVQQQQIAFSQQTSAQPIPFSYPQVPWGWPPIQFPNPYLPPQWCPPWYDFQPASFANYWQTAPFIPPDFQDFRFGQQQQQASLRSLAESGNAAAALSL